ncbi:MAG: hypothetical protein PHI37_04375 [Candidatus Gracilibacteria bacterium]|nr:hypothetical protein [Candidatus Gracilibacteria bacterium]
MNNFIFTKNGEKAFLNLDKNEQERVIKKLKLFKDNLILVNNLKSLTNMSPATHRLRIGSIRVIVQKIDENTYYILDIGYRGDIYKLKK